LGREAGLPDGVLNLIIGGPETGAAISQHPGINKISFTGGPSTARKIMQSAANNLVPVVFELGGKGANLADSAFLLEQYCRTMWQIILRRLSGLTGQNWP
jgi:aldehyde dehydrogenase (NAD+)